MLFRSPCDACGNKIEELAILTGDQTYCANCFRCRNCKRKIENLRYARTSQGIFCMACHESLMARRRKKSREKQDRLALDMIPGLNKSLPVLPTRFSPEESLKQVSTAPPETNFRNRPSSSGFILAPEPPKASLRPRPLFFCTTYGSVADSAANFIQLLDGSYIFFFLFFFISVILYYV